jgi:transglutaminase-like putative cysteine protease
MKRSLRHVSISVLLLAVAACSAPTPRHDRVAAPPTAAGQGLVALPFDGFWSGITFNGTKVGFSRLRIARDGDGYRLDQDAVLRLHFLGVDKRVQLHTTDWVGADLALRAFAYDHAMDDSRRRLEGRVADGALTVRRADGSEERLALEGPVYPMSASALYPVVHGLAVGRRYACPVYDGETETITRMEQAVTAFAEDEGFAGPAFRIDSRVHGQAVTTWTSPAGLPWRESSLGGVLVATLEDEAGAQRYLAEAALGKSDVLLDFSRVPAAPIARPRAVTAAELRLRDGGVQPPPPDGPVQQCTVQGRDWVCRVRPAGGDPGPVAAADLGSSRTVPAALPLFAETAHAIVGATADPRERVQRLLAWMGDNIAKSALDVFSALDVLERRKAECQGHSYLYAAFARSLGIPTRIVNGLVYAPEHDGFLYHTWAESHLDGTWVAVDPTFGQLPADATHLKLVEGESLEAVVPMLDLIGRVGIEALALDYAE